MKIGTALMALPLALAAATVAAAPVAAANRWTLDGHVLGGSSCYAETYSEGGWTRTSEVCELLIHSPTSDQGPTLVRCQRDACASGRCPAPALPHRGKRGGPIERCAIAAEGGAVQLRGWISAGQLFVSHLEAQ